MTKSYSIDLRERVIAHIEDGHTCRATARAFDVSASFAVKLVSRWRATGSTAPARQGRPPGGGKLAPHRDFLIERVEKTPDITMPELAAELDAICSIQVSPASLSRFLCAAGFTYKKNTSGFGARTRRCPVEPAHMDGKAPAKNAT